MADLNDEEQRCWWHKTKKILIDRVTRVIKTGEHFLSDLYTETKFETITEGGAPWQKDLSESRKETKHQPRHTTSRGNFPR